ncbi:MAG TPA: phosphohydrolase [Rhodospirillaceae bacterium]|nr:MAG: phosphohydrolase [Alphaproteobacteria bacterium GWF2_58_20]HAU29439.1 phosphohydrolase [Rhodospirillaceae bacterium]
MNNEDFQLVVKALHFATQKHKNQRRKGADAIPYINHPVDLLHILVNEADIVDPVVLCAALLHDTVEDTSTSPDELRSIFGDEITNVVLEATDDKRLPKEQRKQLQIEHAAHASPRAKLVKLADKICNLQDMAISPPAGWSDERIAAYFDWASQVVEKLRGTHPVLENIFEKAHDMKASRLNRT